MSTPVFVTEPEMKQLLDWLSVVIIQIFYPQQKPGPSPRRGAEFVLPTVQGRTPDIFVQCAPEDLDSVLHHALDFGIQCKTISYQLQLVTSYQL